jgi:hypothetical protein
MATAAFVHYSVGTVVVVEKQRKVDMVQRETNRRPVVVIVALALVGALLVGLATAGLLATAGATGAAPAGLFDWLGGDRPEERPPVIAQPCITDLLTTSEGRQSVLLVPGDDTTDCGW